MGSEVWETLGNQLIADLKVAAIPGAIILGMFWFTSSTGFNFFVRLINFGLHPGSHYRHWKRTRGQ